MRETPAGKSESYGPPMWVLAIAAIVILILVEGALSAFVGSGTPKGFKHTKTTLNEVVVSDTITCVVSDNNTKSHQMTCWKNGQK